MFLDYVGLRKALRAVIQMCAGPVGTVIQMCAGQVGRGSPLATPTMQAVQESWKGPGTRHVTGVWGFVTVFDDSFPSTRGLYFRQSQLCILQRVMNYKCVMYVRRCFAGVFRGLLLYV